eukprot:TRINITY_DN8116_c0_g2_i1.p1 TRINITY_DN8116_c0_g2~~TRINITY_DN8116_c0_g2_i1.p1  ORF type:complete len:332 (-),score=83.27 TRINITY_DN8116_c0_g2_i1:218-1213(-)
MFLLVRYARRWPLPPRIYGGYIVFFGLMLIFPFIDEKVNRPLGFTVMILSACAFGLADASAQGSVWGLVGLFPPKYAVALQVGTGIAGIIVSINRIITKASLPDNPSGLRTSSIIYFVISAIVIAGSIFAYAFLQRLPITKWALSKQVRATMDLEQMDGDVWQKVTIDRMQILRKVFPLALCVWANYTITLFMFPGMITSIPSSSDMGSWFPVILVTIFSVFDFAGKFIPEFFGAGISDRALFVFTGFRIIHFFLFLMCISPRVFNNNLFPYFFVALFATTHGYVGSVGMMRGPTRVDEEEKEVAGTIMALSLVLGVATGASIGSSLPYVI